MAKDKKKKDKNKGGGAKIPKLKELKLLVAGTLAAVIGRKLDTSDGFVQLHSLALLVGARLEKDKEFDRLVGLIRVIGMAVQVATLDDPAHLESLAETCKRFCESRLAPPAAEPSTPINPENN